MSTSLDTKVIGKLAEILDKNNLTGIEYEDEGCRISLSRTVQGAVATIAAPAYQSAPAAAPAFRASSSPSPTRRLSSRWTATRI